MGLARHPSARNQRSPDDEEKVAQRRATSHSVAADSRSRLPLLNYWLSLRATSLHNALRRTSIEGVVRNSRLQRLKKWRRRWATLLAHSPAHIYDSLIAFLACVYRK
jgi:hypothetical protein